jgi:hypothetical protein
VLVLVIGTDPKSREYTENEYEYDKEHYDRYKTEYLAFGLRCAWSCQAGKRRYGTPQNWHG